MGKSQKKEQKMKRKKYNSRIGVLEISTNDKGIAFLKRVDTHLDPNDPGLPIKVYMDTDNRPFIHINSHRIFLQ
jgi:hypothetical protein